MHVSTPAAPSPAITLVQLGGNASLDPLIIEAASRAFGTAVVRPMAGIDAIAEAADPEPTLMLLVQPDLATFDLVAGMSGADRLPRWGVIVFGGLPAGASSGGNVEVVGDPEWNASLLARVFRLVASRHALQRENAQLRQDFATYGHRIAHDLRTPLGGVLTSTEMLREVLTEDSPASVPFTAPVLDSAEGLVKLIDRISFLAKANARREPGELLEMGTVFWNAFQKLESQVLKAGAVLTQAQSWPKVRGHGSSLEMVWRSLIANALEHGGTAVRIDAGWDEVADGNRFWLSSSRPVPADKQATLFFPFHRLHEPGAPRGLGLPMVHRLVELDGGRCGYEQTPEGLARFYFVLPKA